MAIHFERLTGTTFIARGPTNLGLYAFGQDEGAFAVAIDSGGDEDAGRRVVREAERLGLRLTALLNTHSNADHCGGNAFVWRRTGCAIVATEIEAAFLRFPQLEPSFLAGGYPQKAIRNKFLMAPPSRATHILEPPCAFGLDERGAPRISAPRIAPSKGSGADTHLGALSIGADTLSIVALPGHYFGMVGAKTPDGVFFIADALAGAPIIEKYGVYFFYDLAAELETLSMLEHAEAEWFVPSHAEPVRDIKPLVALNRDKIYEIAEYIVKLAAEGPAGAASGTLGGDSHAESTPSFVADASLEDIVAGVCARYNIALNAEQHVLVGSTIRSYLSWLCDQGRLEYGFERNRMIFRKPQ